jgi:FkbM family methyltransferase
MPRWWNLLRENVGQRGPLPLSPNPLLSLEEGAQRRVELTVSCRDADAIPKVRESGELRVQDGLHVQVMHEGTRVLAGAYHGEWMSEIIRRLRGHHEPQEEVVVHRILERLRGKQDPMIVELGAFWAYYAIWAMRAVGGRGVIVEPDPGNLEVGRTNLRLNGLTALCVQAAVGGPHGSTRQVLCESDEVERDLRVVTLAGLMAEHGLEHLDLVLADVQGPEDDVLARATTQLVDRRIRFLVISTHHESISGDSHTHERCLETLADAGAHIIAAHTVEESFSGDGLIAASTDPRDAEFKVEVSRCDPRASLFAPQSS